MEWNWKIKNCMIDVTPFLLFESSADSDDAITADIHHHQEKQEDAITADVHHHQEKQEQEFMDDDAESCSHNLLPFQSNAKFHDTHHHKEHEDDDDDDDDDGHGHGHDDQDDIDDDDDDDDENWGESKMMGQEKRCHDLCADSSNLDPGNQSDVDRKFWETCLGS